jgi:hypothetical protein
MDFIAKCERYAELKAEIEERERTMIAPLKDELNALKEAILAEHPASGLGSSFKLSSGAKVSFADTMTVKVTDMDAVVGWFKDKGMGDMLTYDVKVGSAKLQAVVKEEAGAMRELPPGIEIGQFTQLRLTKS